MKNADMPAMPCGESYKTQQSYGGDWVECKKGALYNGLTKREMFAMAAMQGILASLTNDTDDISPENLARSAIRNADALLAELERRKPKC